MYSTLLALTLVTGPAAPDAHLRGGCSGHVARSGCHGARLHALMPVHRVVVRERVAYARVPVVPVAAKPAAPVVKMPSPAPFVAVPAVMPLPMFTPVRSVVGAVVDAQPVRTFGRTLFRSASCPAGGCPR